MERLSRTKLESMIRSAGYQFISVKFTKKNGDVRLMHGRLGVKKYLQGGTNKVVKDTNSYMVLWDKQASGYRTINLDTVTELKMNHHQYLVI